MMKCEFYHDMNIWRLNLTEEEWCALYHKLQKDESLFPVAVRIGRMMQSLHNEVISEKVSSRADATGRDGVSRGEMVTK